MGYNGKLLARARERLARRREENAAEQARRLEQAYAAQPALREIDTGLRRQMIELSRLAMSRDPQTAERLERLRSENLELQRRRAEALVEAGLPINYTDELGLPGHGPGRARALPLPQEALQHGAHPGAQRPAARRGREL